MDLLEAHKEDIEHALYFRLANLLSLDVELLFYDTTSLHFEIDEMDQGHGEDDLVEGSLAAGSKTYKAPRKRGLSKNGRSDAPQIVIGLAVTRDGLPVRHWVFPGNTVDVSTVAQVKDDLRGWKLSRCVFVGDAGMVSQDNLKKLSESGGKYILCMPMRRGDEVTHEVLQRPGRYQQVSDHLRVKEVVVGEGERRRRYVVCHNPQEEKRQRAHRRQVLRELEAELASLQEVRGENHSKRVCQLRASRRYGRYLRLTKGGLLRLDAANRRSEEQLDGKFVVHSNDASLTPADLALGYKQLQRVEEAWRTLKSGLRLRPVYHWAVHRIQAHVALSVLALLLERVIEQACGDTWRNIRADLEQIKLAQLLSPHGEVWQVTEPSLEAAKHLTCLEIKNPPTVLHLT
jgi:transposase